MVCWLYLGLVLDVDLCGVGHRVKIAPTIWCNFFPHFSNCFVYGLESIPMFHNWFVHFLLLSKKHIDIFQLQKFFFFLSFTLEFNDIWCYSYGWCKLIHLWTAYRFICVVPTFQSDVVLGGNQHNPDTWITFNQIYFLKLLLIYTCQCRCRV